MASLFDTHAHYTDEKFGDPTELLNSLFSGDICGILCAGTDEKTSIQSIALAKKYEKMYAAAGIHPHECGAAGEINSALDRIVPLFAESKVKALGEIGLDYYYDFSDRETQRRFFDAQLSLAETYSLPVIIHDREAHGDVFDIVCAHPNVTGIMHSYSGSAEQAKEYVRRGYYISFSGSLTFKNASKLLEAARVVPADKFLIETDCPYLAPVPMRGKTNHSGYMHYTAEKAAELLGMDYEAFCDREVRNARAIFGIDE